MPRWINALWKDEHGFIISAELVLIASLLIVGLIVGLTSLQGAVNGELSDVAGAIRSLDQSYYYHGHSARMWNHGYGAHGYRGGNGCDACNGLKSWTAGSYFFNRRRTADCEEDITGCPNGIPVVPEKKVVPAPKVEPVPAKPCLDCPTTIIPESGPQIIPPCGTCLPDATTPGTPLTPSADPKSVDPKATPEAAPQLQPMLPTIPTEPATPPREHKPRKKGDAKTI